jgi:hypothetical protein
MTIIDIIVLSGGFYKHDPTEFEVASPELKNGRSCERCRVPTNDTRRTSQYETLNDNDLCPSIHILSIVSP